MDGGNNKGLFIRLPENVYQSVRELSFFGGQPMREIVLQALLDWGLHEKARKSRQQARKGEKR